MQIEWGYEGENEILLGMRNQEFFRHLIMHASDTKRIPPTRRVHRHARVLLIHAMSPGLGCAVWGRWPEEGREALVFPAFIEVVFSGQEGIESGIARVLKGISGKAVVYVVGK